MLKFKDGQIIEGPLIEAIKTVSRRKSPFEMHERPSCDICNNSMNFCYGGRITIDYEILDICSTCQHNYELLKGIV